METQFLTAGEWSDRARALKDDGWWLMAYCAIDRLHLSGDPRFEMVAQLLHPGSKDAVIVHVGAEGDPPTIPSLTEIFPTTRAMEREAFDLMGIRFEGHENLKRIFLPDGWEGHPLRKDYGVGKVPLEFLPQPFLQIDQPGQAPSPEEAGADVDELGQSGRAR